MNKWEYQYLPIAILACDFPHHCEALIETEFFPHLEALLTSKLASLYAPMDLPMLEAIRIPHVIESDCFRDRIE